MKIRTYLRPLAVAVACVLAAPAAPDATEPARKGRPTLDDLAAHTEMERRSDGSVHWMRTFRHPIPWEEYVAALAAEQPSAEATSIMDPGTEPDPGAGGTLDTLLTCTPPDDDYDGDGFTLTTSPTDTFPLRRGEYVADRPRVKGAFTSFIEPGIDVLYSGDIETTFEYTRFYESDLLEKTTVKDTREFKKKFNGSFGLKLGLVSGKAPNIELNLGLGGETERSRTYTWTEEKTRSTQLKFTDIRKKKETNKLSFGPTAGRVTGQVTVYNLSDYAIDMSVTNLRVAVVAYSPFTGDKYALGDVNISGTYILGYGSGNNSASAFVGLTTLNTLDMMNRLAEGWVFDMEVAYFAATDLATGGSVTPIISRVNQRNARISIHYGDATERQYGQVSVFAPASACLTGRDMLTTYIGAANVEFGRTPDGALVVTRINHRANRWAEYEFDDLTPEQQAEYGRWVVGYDYYNQTLTTFDLETTYLTPEDKVFFYYLTAADFVDDPGPPDESTPFSVANNGSAPASQLVAPVSTNDTVQITASNDFQIESSYSQYVGNIYNSRCGYVYRATWYGHQVTTDSNLHSITVPNVDWYGLQVDFGGLGWRALSNVLADPDAEGRVVSFRGFPYYDFTVEFRVTPAMLETYPTRNLQVRNANARQTFSVGYEGYDVLGRRISCRWNDTGGMYANTGSVDNWYHLGGADDDRDTFYAVASTGIDFDDANPRRFPFAPEHLDGIDNNGDGTIDNAPLLCPESLDSLLVGTCRLDNRAGWYPAQPNTYLERRFKRSDGTFTSWEAIGSGLTTYQFTMTSDPTLTEMHVRTTYYPSGGGSFSGTTVVRHTSGAEVPLFPVGVDVEAESGRIVAPMRVDTVSGETFVHVPAGTPVYGSASADWRFQVTVTGDYLIWSRVSATSSGDDSFLVSVVNDQGQPVGFGFNPPAHFRLETADPYYDYQGFGWTRVNHWNPYVTPTEYVNPVLYHLTPGTYTVQFRPRELGTRLDKLRVERWCPDADADGYTTCAGDCNDANPDVRPGRGEVCSTSYDDDCDGYVNEGCGGSGSPVYKKPPIEIY